MGDEDNAKQRPWWANWMVVPCVVAVGVMVAAGIWATPEKSMSALDRIFFWSFVVFAIGLAELFVVLIVLTILGKLQLTQVFRDKEHLKVKEATLSLSRLQAFLWTLVVMTVFFHSAATHPGEGIPTIPPEILLLMGISGAVYLAGKHLSVQNAAPPSAAKGGGGER